TRTGPIQPGETLGIFGDGQLGRMFVLAAGKMGYRVAVFGPGQLSPAGELSSRRVIADYSDEAEVRDFAKCIRAATVEFENIPSSIESLLPREVPLRPSGSLLHTAQNRLREKEFLAKAGVPVAPYRAVNDLNELKQGLAEIGTPAILKTAEFGYDGKGQATIADPTTADSAWEAISSKAVLERK